MRTIIHIGTPKTGTSAIQKFFVENKELLSFQGFYYPEHSLDVNGISSGNGAQLLHMMKIGERKKAKKLRDSFYKDMQGETLIISSENFYREPELTYELFPDAEIVVYIREQSEQILADYNQSVKRHFQVHFFDHALNVALKRNDPFFNFELLDDWLKLYGVDKMNVRIYDPSSFPNNNIVSDFLSFLDINMSLTLADKEQKINVSYYRDAVHFKIWFNRLIIDQHNKFVKEHQIVDYALQKFSQKCASENIQDYSFYSKKNKERVKNFYSNYNKKIVQYYFNRKHETLFHHNEDKNLLSPYPGLKNEKIIEIAQHIQSYSPEVFTVFKDLIVSSKSSNNKMVVDAAKKLSPLLTV